MIDKLFYYYYLCYDKIIYDVWPPQYTVIYTFSFIVSWIMICPIDLFFAYSFHINIFDKWIMIGIFLLILLLKYLYFIRTGRWKRIVEEKPKFRNSNKLSVIVTIAFTIFGLLLMFITPIITKEFLISE
jgi:hypothetical protein